MRIFTAIVVLFTAAFVTAAEQPADNPKPAVFSKAQRDFADIDHPGEAEPVWLTLQTMTLAERQNALIDIELFGETLNRASALAERIENLWNNEASYAEALRLFDELGRLVDFRRIALGISWRRPIETTDLPTWGTDIRIGVHDSINLAHLDIHRASGNLFVVLQYQSGSNHSWSMNFSTNNGNTWAETFTWNTYLRIPDLGMAVVSNNCFVSYFSNASPFDARLRKFSATTGAPESFSGGSSFITVFSTAAPDSMREVELVSNQDDFSTNLYYLAISHSGTLHYYWDTSPFETWNQVATSITNAERGLDACWNEGYSSRFLWVSYYDNTDNLRIAARSTSSWDVLDNYNADPGSRTTSIGAWRDTITCFFEYLGDNWQCRYRVTFNGGTNFAWGWIGDTTVTAETPLMTARDGGGVGVVFRHYTSPRQGRYTRRRYIGGWSTPVQYTDYEPHWYPGAIEYLGGYTHGVVYITNNLPAIRAAMFDKHSATDITLSPQVPDKILLAENYPNPFNSATIIRYNLGQPARVMIDIYDLLGRKVAGYDQGRQAAGTHLLTWNGADFASGVYLCKIHTEDESQTLKMLLVK